MTINMNQILAKQGKWFFVIAFVVISFSASSVFASPPAPTPMCQISGVIKSVEFKEAYDEACLKEPYGCPTDMELNHPARYFFDVSINSVSHVSGDTSFNTCQNIYSVGKVQKIFINKDKVKSGDIFSVNQKIDGIVRSFWGASFDSYTLGTITQPQPVKLTISGYVVSGGDTTPQGLFDAPRKFVYKIKTDTGSIIDVTYTAYPPSPVGDQERKKIRLSFHAGSVLIGDYLQARGSFAKSANVLTVADEGDYIETSQKSQPPEKPIIPPVKENVVLTTKSSSEISAMLVEQKQLKAVDDIELSSDEQQYTVRGYHDAKFLFFIPVSVKVELKINAVNGNIEQVKKSWWAFLVRY